MKIAIIREYIPQFAVKEIEKLFPNSKITYFHFPQNVKEFDLFFANGLLGMINTGKEIFKYANCGEIKAVHMTVGPLLSTCFIHPRGGWAQYCRNDEILPFIEKYSIKKYQNIAKELKNKILERNLHRYKQPGHSDELNKNCIFLPMQYTRDATILIASKFNKSFSYLHEYLDVVARFCSDNNLILAIKPHPSVKEKERIKQLDYIDFLKKKYGNSKIIKVNGNINDLCRKALFVSTINSSCYINALITGSVMTTCGFNFLQNSGAVVHNENVYDGLVSALKICNSSELLNKYLQKQAATLCFLFYDCLLVDDCLQDFYNLNSKKILRNVVESLLVEPLSRWSEFEITNKDNDYIRSVFGVHYDSILDLDINKNFNGVLRYPSDLPISTPVDGYSLIKIKAGDSLWKLFGDKWEHIYNLPINESFRKNFPHPTYILPGYYIYVPDENNIIIS